MQTFKSATATETVNDGVTATKLKPFSWEPTHAALALVPWEDERTDIHSVTGGQCRIGEYSFSCACGYDTGVQLTEFEASALIISHAMHTCAVCQGEKPSVVAFGPTAGQLNNFPRCSGCAF